MTGEKIATRLPNCSGARSSGWERSRENVSSLRYRPNDLFDRGSRLNDSGIESTLNIKDYNRSLTFQLFPRDLLMSHRRAKRLEIPLASD